MSSSGCTKGVNTVRVDAVLADVEPHPPHGAFDIVKAVRERVIGEFPVVYRDNHIPAPGELVKIPPLLDSGTMEPCASMDSNNGWQAGRGPFFRLVYIQTQGLSVRTGVRHSPVHSKVVGAGGEGANKNNTGKNM